MRKILTASLVASTALFITACGKTENAATTDANTMVTELNASDALEGTVNDTMTNVDGAMGSDNAVVANDSAANATADTNTTAAANSSAANAM